jgi:hypothetical protein
VIPIYAVEGVSVLARDQAANLKRAYKVVEIQIFQLHPTFLRDPSTPISNGPLLGIALWLTDAYNERCQIRGAEYGLDIKIVTTRLALETRGEIAEHFVNRNGKG